MRITAWIGHRRGARALVLGVVAMLATPVLPTDMTGQLAGGTALAQTQTSADAAAKGVVIQGNRRIEEATIISYMQLPADRATTADDLNAAVRRLFDTGLFKNVEIAPGDGQIVIVVEENPSINVIAFEGNSSLKDEDLQQIISLRPRLPFTRSAAEADAQSIIEIYRRTGRYGAEVEPVIIERTENRVDVVFEINEGEITGVKAIDFVGNEKFSDRRLRKVVDTSESGLLAYFISTDVYDPDRLELDKELLRQFYLERGYADFTVLSATAELAPDREGFFITFTVEEGEEYVFGPLDVSVTAKGLDPEDFRALLPVDLEGTTYNATKVETIADEMTDLAGQKGFAFVQVRPRPNKNSADKTVGVTFELAEGSRIFIERIDIVGNTQTLDRVIRRQIPLVEGDAFDTRKIRDARTRIRGLGYFKTVDVETAQGSADDRAVVTVKVQEQSTGNLSLGFGYSSSQGPIGSVQITERNFLGRGQIVNARLTAAGDTQIYDASFTEPAFLDRDLSIGARGYYLNDDREDELSFNQNQAGFVPEVGFPLAEDLRIKLRYSFVWDDIDVNDNPANPFDVSPAIVADDGKQITSSVGYTLTHDKRDDLIEPTSGYLTSFDQEFAGLGGDSQFVKSRAKFKTWYGLFDDQVISSVELEGGALFSLGSEDSRVTERYFVGGSNMRGFASAGIGPRDLGTDDALGGNYFSVARMEVSFPLGLPEELGIYGGAFLDAGTLWGLDRTNFTYSNGDPDNIDDSAHFRAAAGALLFLDTPIGPLELSFGYPLVKESYDEKEVFRLSIGTRF